MKFIDAFIASIAPKYGVRRLQARQAIKAFYEAAKPSHLRKTRTDTGSADAVVAPAGESLRIQARHLEQNSDIARGIIDVLVSNIVGTGIRPEPQVRNTAGELDSDTNSKLLDLWRDWVRSPEVTGEFDYYACQRLAARTWLRDGECLSQLLEGNIRGLDHGTKVPFSIELIEPDYLPYSLNDDQKGIVQGVQKNAWGKPRFYHIHKRHPGDQYYFAESDTKRVPAEQMLHVKLTDRIRQTRGISILASVITRLDDVKEIDESERVAARVAAAMAGFIRKGAPDMYIAPPDGNLSGYREMEFMPGIIFDDLQTGEEIGTIDSKRPNNALIPFRDSQLRSAAAGVGAGYSSISKNYNGTYSAQRQELVEQYGHYGVMWSYFSERFCRPVWERFVKMALSSGLIETDGIDMDTLYDVDHSRPAMPWIDPQKELNGIEKELSLRIASRSQIIRRRGGNPDEIKKQIALEKEQDIELGLESIPVPDDPEEEEETIELEDDTGNRYVMSIYK